MSERIANGASVGLGTPAVNREGAASTPCSAAPASPRRLDFVRLSLPQANEFVAAWHRHNDLVVGHLWSVGLADDSGILHAVMIVGRPISKALDNGDTVEVLRIAAGEAWNCNSRLYGAAARAAFAMGFHRVITTIDKAEGGSSLRASGYRLVADRPARKGWDTQSRPRDNRKYRSVPRQLWEAVA